MNPAQVLIGLIGVAVSITTFCLLRYPHVRRARLRQYGAFSLGASLLGAAIVLTLCMMMILAQGD